jgi:hypothetical protein
VRPSEAGRFNPGGIVDPRLGQVRVPVLSKTMVSVSQSPDGIATVENDAAAE